jgi:Trm5-related predicted tRNA methylase
MAMELHLFTVENKELVKFNQFINEDKNKILGNKETFDRVVLLDPKEHI